VTTMSPMSGKAECNGDRNAYRDQLTGLCLPYIQLPHEIVPDLSCVQWTAHPLYMQAVVGINAAKSQLVSYGINTRAACVARTDQVAAIISQVYDGTLGGIARNLLACACKNSSLPEQETITVPARLACTVLPQYLPPNASPHLCSAGVLPFGSQCVCPGIPAPYPGIIQSAPAWWRD
jgi:hypothetical protein